MIFKPEWMKLQQYVKELPIFIPPKEILISIEVLPE